MPDLALGMAFGGTWGMLKMPFQLGQTTGFIQPASLQRVTSTPKNPPRGGWFCTVLAHHVVPGSLDPWLEPLRLV